jgi:uncharacterized protein YkwD
MARIHIDDLPPAETLTPEQEELILGAGLRSFRPRLESLEAREVMSANFGSALVVPPPAAQPAQALFSNLATPPANAAPSNILVLNDSTQRGGGGDLRTQDIGAARLEVLNLVNAERAKFNLPALTGNWTLATMAQSHSEDMARTGVTDHNTGNGGIGPRATTAGYTWTNGAVGENVSSGVTPAEAVQGWMNSTMGHRENILGTSVANGIVTNFTEIGVGVAYRGGVAYYTVVFGRPG